MMPFFSGDEWGNVDMDEEDEEEEEDELNNGGEAQ